MYYKKFDFGDVTIHFAEIPAGGKKTTAGMCVAPREAPFDPKRCFCPAMVQAAFFGDEPHLARTAGEISASRTLLPLKITRQVMFVNGDLNTYLSGEHGDEFVHRLKYERSTGVFSVNVRYENRSGETRVLEFLSAFSLGGFCNFGEPFALTLTRMAGAERAFCKQSAPVSALGLYREGASERWGAAGGELSRKFYPFAALSFGETALALELETPFSWHMELLNHRGDLAFSGGAGDFEGAHFRKKIAPGDSFETPRAMFTLQKSLENACAALVKDLEKRLPVPPSEEDLPVLYLDGTAKKSTASPARIGRNLKILSELSVGVYLFGSSARKYFPDGLSAAASKICGAGLRAGILYDGSADFPELSDELFLKREGNLLSVRGRRFPDLRREEFKQMLLSAAAELKEGGFEYAGVACDSDFGIGCDGAGGASIGEGGRRAAVDGVRYLEQFAKTSAVALFSPLGEKIEPYRAGKIDLNALSYDTFLPLAAANLARVVGARRILIPVPLDKDETDAKTEFSLCTAFLGRVCLSGDLAALSPEKIALLKRGLSFYVKAADILKNGGAGIVDCTVLQGPSPSGRQIVVREFGDAKLIVVHCYDFEGTLKLPLEGYSLAEAFCSLAYSVRGDALRIAAERGRACAFLLKKSVEGGGV